MDNFIEEQRVVNVQANKELDTVENSLDQKLDEFQSEMDKKIDNLQYSISRLTIQQHFHQEEVHPEEECLIDTTLEEQCKQQKEETSPMLTEEGSRKEEIEEPQKSTAQATNSSLPEAPSPDLVYTLPAAQPLPEEPAPTAEAKVIPSTLPALQNLKKLVAIVQTFVTTSKKMAAAHIAWHNGWFGCWFGFEAPEPQHSYELHQFQQPPKA